jgi:hypothetical protein
MNARRLEGVGLLVTGAVAAGVHAGLAPAHLCEWPPLGASFVVAAVAVSAALAVFALGRAPRALAVLLGGLIVAYVATRLAALPPLDPEREPLDRLGVVTTAVEGVGLLLALDLSRPRGGTT